VSADSLTYGGGGGVTLSYLYAGRSAGANSTANEHVYVYANVQ